MLFDQNTIKQEIMKVVVYFDMFDFPMVTWEIYKYLAVETSYNLVAVSLQELVSSKKLENNCGYYFLPGRRSLILERQRRYYYTDRKILIATRASRLFSIIPWVRLIAVGNIIGNDNLRDGSDIDLFIVSRKSRLWLTRFICALIAIVCGWRPNEKKSQDKICLSFFVADSQLDLNIFRRETNDKYFIYWLAGLRTVFDRDSCLNELFSQNDWIKKCLPNYFFSENNYIVLFQKKYSFIDKVERFFMSWQLKKFPGQIKNLMNKNCGVIVNENVLKLHINDRRELFENNFMALWKKFGI